MLVLESVLHIKMLASDYILHHLLFDHFTADELFVLVLALLYELLCRLCCVLLDELGVIEPVDELVISHLILEVV